MPYAMHNFGIPAVACVHSSSAPPLERVRPPQKASCACTIGRTGYYLTAPGPGWFTNYKSRTHQLVLGGLLSSSDRGGCRLNGAGHQRNGGGSPVRARRPGAVRAPANCSSDVSEGEEVLTTSR
jgi:hypothetical protein